MKRRTRGMPWRVLVAVALLSTAVATTITLINLSQSRAVIGGLIHTGPEGPAAALLAHDFPDDPQFKNGEHDGPMFYAIARNFGQLDVASKSLDRPRYRLQRPVYPLLAWVLYPTGTGGDGLVWAMFIVNVVAVAAGAFALGALSWTLRGPPWVGVIFPLLPGVLTTMRISVADALAVALMLGATVLFVRERVFWAALLAALAVLSKEPVAITFIGLALWRRERSSFAFLAAPAGAAIGWGFYLRWRVPDSGHDVLEFGRPFQGLARSWDILWSHGRETSAIASVIIVAVLVVVVLVRCRPSHPLYWATVLNAVMLTPLTVSVIGLERNGPRAVMPATVIALVAVVAPGPALRSARAPAVTSLSATAGDGDR